MRLRIAASASDQLKSSPNCSRGSAPPARPHGSRRTLLLSVGSLIAVPPMDVASAVRGELSLWGQELQLYQRQFKASLQEAAPWAVPQPQVPVRTRPPIDAQLAKLLLRLPLDAIEDKGNSSQPILPTWSRSRYEADLAVITKQELPYYKKAGACGACGGDDLSDADWFDFQSYCQWKAVARQLPAGMRRDSSLGSGMDMLHGGTLFQAPAQEQQTNTAIQDSSTTQPTQPTPAQQLVTSAAASQQSTEGQQTSDATEARQQAPTALQALQRRIGQQLLQHIQASDAVSGDVRAVLGSGSAGLDSIRAGTRGLLRYFTDKGFAVRSGIEQMGISRDEFENHEVWAAGEPAFVKIWLERPATARSQEALEQEEGFSQDFIPATLTAYLASCGVDTEAFRRYPSYSNPDFVALQCTLRRRPNKQLSPQDMDATEYAPFLLDLCPNGDDTGCY